MYMKSIGSLNQTILSIILFEYLNIENNLKFIIIILGI